MSVEYLTSTLDVLRPMMDQQLSQNTRGHCRPSTREGGKGGAHRARALSAAGRGPLLSTRNPRPKESARPGGAKVDFPACFSLMAPLILVVGDMEQAVSIVSRPALVMFSVLGALASKQSGSRCCCVFPANVRDAVRAISKLIGASL